MRIKVWMMSLQTLAIVCLLYGVIWMFGYKHLFFMMPVAINPNPELTFGKLEEWIEKKLIK